MKRKFEAAFNDWAQFGASLRLYKFNEEFTESKYNKLVTVFNNVKSELTQYSVDTDDDDPKENSDIYKLLLKLKKCAVKLNLAPLKKLRISYIAGKDLANDVGILQEQLKKLTNVISKNNL